MRQPSTETDKSAGTKLKEYMNNKNPYDDIINLPHHRSKTRKYMSIHDRAAQFAPFSALTGHDEAVKETARLTERRVELDEYQKSVLNDKLLYIKEHIPDEIIIEITYFKPDLKKTGGEYAKKSGTVKKIREYERLLIMDDLTEIPIREIISIESEVFDE